MNFEMVCCSDGEKRPVWSSQFEFMVVAIGATIGSRHIWFPYTFLRNDGGMFLIPFFFFLVLVGLPLTCTGLSLGQFTSKGPLSCWNFSPFFKGIGLMLILNAITSSTQLNSSLCLLFHILFDSFRSELPWARCDPKWSDKGCFDASRIVSSRDECHKFNATPSSDYYNGACVDKENEIVAIWNSSSDDVSVISRILTRSPSSLYIEDRAAFQTDASLTHLGPIIWDDALISLLVWFIVASILSISVKSYGKVAYFLTLCPMCLLVVFFVFGLTLDGHKEGLKLYWNPRGNSKLEIETLQSYRTWGRAGADVLYTFGVGKLITLGSYNRFKSDTIRDSVILCLAYTGACLLSVMTIANFLGHYANHIGQPPAVIFDYLDITYVMMIEVALTTSVPVLWTVMWFIMLICFTLSFKLIFVKIILTSCLDVFPKLRRFRLFVVILTCSILYLLGLPISTEGKNVLLVWVNYCTRWNSLLTPGFVAVALIIYGIPRFMRDIGLMIGGKTLWFIPVKLGQIIIGCLLVLPAPVLIAVTCAFIIGDDELYVPEWPEQWAENIRKVSGWTIAFCLVLGAIWSVIEARKRLSKDCFVFLFPSDDWGPALPEHRALVTKYVPWLKHEPSQSGHENSAATLDEIYLQERL